LPALVIVSSNTTIAGINQMCRMFLGLLGCTMSVLILPAVVVAQAPYPHHPITMIVPFAAGGSSDVIARLVAEEMGKDLGQRIVNENVAGAGGAIALSRAAKSDPDGYTIVIGNSGTNAASYSIYPDLKYTNDDFMPIGMVAKTSPMIAVKKYFQADTFASFITYAKANPGKVTLGHAGVGSSNYLICKMFEQASGANVTLVSYRGAGPALNDLMGGQIDGVCDAATALTGAIQGNIVKPLVVATPSRIGIFPDIPTAAESGLPGFAAQGWNAIFVPKGTPAPVVARLNLALRNALATEALGKRFKELASVIPSVAEQTPEHLAAFVPAEIAKYKVLLQGK
jgi:tripartite-type tricarboxylate transporter receptor subunit TctC